MSLSEAGPRIVRSIPEFDCQNTRDVLAGTSIACPPVDSQAFESYLSYFMRRGFLDAPPAGGMV
jgi:hypothetical protein